MDYSDDIGNPSQFATVSGITPAAALKNFFVVTLIADIVAVNGSKGERDLYWPNTRGSSDPESYRKSAHRGDRRCDADGSPGAYLRNPATRWHGDWHDHKPGLQRGTAPAGSAFDGSRELGDRRRHGRVSGRAGDGGGLGGQGRAASIREDPANRRQNATSYSFILHVIPMEAPRVVELPLLGPAIFHNATNVLVDSAHKATPNGHLYLFATRSDSAPGAAWRCLLPRGAW